MQKLYVVDNECEKSEREKKCQSQELRRLLESKRKTIKGINECEINQKLIRFANSRCFPLEDIEVAIYSHITDK